MGSRLAVGTQAVGYDVVAIWIGTALNFHVKIRFNNSLNISELQNVHIINQLIKVCKDSACCSITILYAPYSQYYRLWVPLDGHGALIGWNNGSVRIMPDRKPFLRKYFPDMICMIFTLTFNCRVLVYHSERHFKSSEPDILGCRMHPGNLNQSGR